MFGLSGVKHQDQGLLELSKMLDQDRVNPTYKGEFFQTKNLDYSIESSNAIMEYFDLVEETPEFEQEAYRSVLRAGAYIGEIIRKYSTKDFHWYDYESACKLSKNLESIGKMLGTAAVLFDKDTREVVFPIGKVMKYIENGAEDNLEFYLKVVTENSSKLNL